MLSLGLAWLYLTQIKKTNKTITERTQLPVVLSGALGREPWHELSVQPSSCALCRALPSPGYCIASDLRLGSGVQLPAGPPTAVKISAFSFLVLLGLETSEGESP